MTGYTIKKALPSELILSRSRIPLFLIIMTVIGIIFISLSVLTKYKMINPPETFFNLFLGMGIIFIAGSIIFMINKIPGSITFNKNSSMIIFSENNQEYSIPFAGFTSLLIAGKISHSKNSTSVSYQLNIVSHNGSAILLCESTDKSDLQKTAETIITYIDIDLLAGGKLLHKGSAAYPADQPVYPPQNIMSIKTDSAGDKYVYQWNCSKSIAAIFLLGAVIFGFNFVFFKCAFPAMGRYNAGVYAVSVILFLIDIFFISTLLFYLFGINIAEISDTGFSYRQKIFGFSINSKTFSRDEITMINAGFTSDDNKITIFTKRGMDIFNEMKIFAEINNLNDTPAVMTLLSKIMELRKNIIEIDGTPLYYYEKLYLENEWSDKLKLKNVTRSVY